MRLCLIGKYPPIQGGVSARTYQLAHGLARRGHDVYVVTNAAEVELPWRIFMRDADWDRCEATYDTGNGSGRVRVGWTDPVDWRQRYIPRNNPSVTKLVSLVLEAHREQPFDLIHSYYLESYGVAAHMAASLLGLPHVAKTAGSDAGKLWRQKQFEPLYDEILRGAELFMAGVKVAERAAAHGVDPKRVAANRGFQLSTRLFRPDGPALDPANLLAEIREQPDYEDLVWGGFRGETPFVGVYGKLGEKKGSFALVEALALARDRGARLGLVAMAHGHPDIEGKFRETVRANGLEDSVLQIPFLPHWRVPQFIRACSAVCCLEQDFPIAIHNPIVVQEVMSCGGCVVASTELLGKQSHGRRLISGLNCIAVADSFDTVALGETLRAIADDPEGCTALGARARRHIERFYADDRHMDRTEALLERARRRETTADAVDSGGEETAPPPSLTGMALDLLDPETRAHCFDIAGVEHETPEWAAAVLRRLGEREPPAGTPAGAPVETARAAVETDARLRSALAMTTSAIEDDSTPFRLGPAAMIRHPADLHGLRLALHPAVRRLDFDFDVSPFLRARSSADLPLQPASRASCLLVRPVEDGEGRVASIPPPLADLLELLDGKTPFGQASGPDESDDIPEQIAGLLSDEMLLVNS